MSDASHGSVVTLAAIMDAITQIRSDVTDLRAEVGQLRNEVTDLCTEVDSLRVEMRDGFEAIHDELREIRAIQDAHGKELNQIHETTREIARKLVRMRDALSDAEGSYEPSAGPESK